jgi:hypothetical protein
MRVCIQYLLSGARSSVETSKIRAYVCIWYGSISHWRSFTLLVWKRELVVAVISNVLLCGRILYIGFSCHLVAVSDTHTWECDFWIARTDTPKV